MLGRRGNAACTLTAIALSFLAMAGCGGEPSPVVDGTPPTADRNVKLPAELRALQRQASQLLDGGKDAFEARVADLRGYPVVVNQWASWCGPCRFEFPFFQRLATKYAGRVAFLGVNSQDSKGDAEDFLRQFPVPFPHYYDKDTSVARVFGGGRAWPTTAFYDKGGKVVNTHLGAYASEAKLEEDIRRYALGG
jgi:cytochrome c biogenesis protein CcmG, thiol:disulfide interchange protein DsbE